MESMRIELEAEGHTVHFVAINDDRADEDQAGLIGRCSFPLFQDTAEVDAWGMHGGQKDDFFVYRPDGTLSAWLPRRGAVNTTLAIPEGRENLRQAIFDALP